MGELKQGDRVSFSWNEGGTLRAGFGKILSVDTVDGTALVACEPEPPEARHFVIHCTLTWLTYVAPTA